MPKANDGVTVRTAPATVTEAVPAIAPFTVSVAVMVCTPDVFSVTLKLCVPLSVGVNAESGGRAARESPLVKWTVPEKLISVLASAGFSTVNTELKDTPGVTVPGAVNWRLGCDPTVTQALNWLDQSNWTAKVPPGVDTAESSWSQMSPISPVPKAESIHASGKE